MKKGIERLLDFWNARIAASTLSRSSDARIPNVPDQTAFIGRWFEWHRGYTNVTDDHGNQELRYLIGERLDQVPPGYLPRTVDELNASCPDHSSPHNTILSVAVARPIFNTPNSDALAIHDIVEPEPQDLNHEDRLFNPPSSISSHSPSQESHIGTSSDSLAYLRQELQRIRTGIEQVMSGIRDLGENPPDSQDAFSQSGVLESHIQEIDGQLDALQQTRMSPPRPLLPTSAITPQNPPTDQHEAATGSSNRDTTSPALANLRNNIQTVEGREASARADRYNAAQALQRAENEVHVAANTRRQLLRAYTAQEANERVFGTREEAERQGADYESPVGEMFTRAYERYRDAEEARRTSEQDGASDSAPQRPQEARARSGGLLEAATSPNAPRTSPPLFLSRHSQANPSQDTIQATQIQTRGSPARSPPDFPSGAAMPPGRPAPYSSTFQYLASRPSSLVQDFHGHRARPMALNPEIPGIDYHHGQPARQYAQFPEVPGIDHLRDQPVRRFTRPPQFNGAMRAHISPDEPRNSPTYTYRPPTATPTTNPSTGNYHSYGLFIPPNDRAPLPTPTMPSSSDSSLDRPPLHALPDFSTIAPDAARMQDVTSQHQRRIIRDIRARRHEYNPSTTAGPSDTNPFASAVYDSNFIASTLGLPTPRASRSEDSASDSSDANLIMNRLRRRRVTASSEAGGDNARLFRPPASTEAQEAMIQRLRHRRQGGMSAAIDTLLSTRGDGVAEDQGPKGLDRDDGRPEPKEEGEMMVNFECKICFSQLASVAVLPCGEFLLQQQQLLVFLGCLGGLANVVEMDRTLRDVQMVRGPDGAEP